jgi:hypothetical protein
LPDAASSTLSWLVDAASETPGADRLPSKLGAHLIADGLPIAGGMLSLAVPHPLIARRTWLWRAASGEVIEPLGSRRPNQRQPQHLSRMRPKSTSRTREIKTMQFTSHRFDL